MAKIMNLVETRQNPEAALKSILEKIASGEVKVERCVVVVETTKGRLDYYASGTRTDVTSCVGLLATAGTRLAMLEN